MENTNTHTHTDGAAFVLLFKKSCRNLFFCFPAHFLDQHKWGCGMASKTWSPRRSRELSARLEYAPFLPFIHFSLALFCRFLLSLLLIYLRNVLREREAAAAARRLEAIYYARFFFFTKFAAFFAARGR
jgi:hypothetical protein